MPDCMYLRKSRVDAEAEAHGEGDTLARHEQALLRHASVLGRSIAKIYREVVSGETISARPQMQTLLRDVESGLWDAVHVMEVERLARGDTLDQGLVSQAFLYSKTLIITPKKTYDPSNEFDEEYFEFGLFMSRREYKTINRRQQAGRLTSLREGKWVSNKEPYGYRRIKLQDQKGWSLVPQEPQASVVCDMFRWLTIGYEENGLFERLGTTRIAQRLNDLGIPSPSGADWHPNSVREILRNEVYAGFIRWGRRAAKKTLSDGVIVTQRPRAEKDSYAQFLGLHPPLISQETLKLAQTVLDAHPTRPGPKHAALKNPLSGLIICSNCGRSMVRRPFQSGRHEVLLCPSPSCKTMASDLCTVETALLSMLADMLDGLVVPKEHEEKPYESEQESLHRALASMQTELSSLESKEKRVFELVEQEVYTAEQFALRSKELSDRKQDIVAKMHTIRLELNRRSEQAASVAQVLPRLHHVLDSYYEAKTTEDKNALLKTILSKVLYSKTTGGRYQESDLQLALFPLFDTSNDQL